MTLDSGINGQNVTAAVVQTTSAALRKRPGLVALQSANAPDDADIQALISMRNDVVAKQLERRAERERAIAAARHDIEKIDKHLEMLGVELPDMDRARCLGGDNAETTAQVRDVDDSIGGKPARQGRRFILEPDGGGEFSITEVPIRKSGKTVKHPSGKTVEELCLDAVSTAKGDVGVTGVRRAIAPPRPPRASVQTALSVLARKGAIGRVAPGVYCAKVIAKHGRARQSIPSRILDVFTSQAPGTHLTARAIRESIAAPIPSREAVHMALAVMASGKNNRIERVERGVYRLALKEAT